MPIVERQIEVEEAVKVFIYGQVQCLWIYKHDSRDREIE